MSVLDPVLHARLIEEITEVARAAGIPRKYIEQSMSDWCTDAEVAWVRRYHHLVDEGVYGLCYVGEPPIERMMAIAGAFTRNFVLAQLVPMGPLLELLRENEPPKASVLLVPSFHRPMKQGGVTAFQQNLLWTLLEARMIAQKQTVIHVQSIAQLGQDYGPHFRHHVENHFEIIV